MKAPAQIWSEGDIVNWIDDVRQSLRFCPSSAVLRVFVNEYFATTGNTRVIATNGNHRWMQSIEVKFNSTLDRRGTRMSENRIIKGKRKSKEKEESEEKKNLIRVVNKECKI